MYQFRGWIVLNLVILSGIFLGTYVYTKIEKKSKKEIEILNISEYSAKYLLKINGNKTQNTYLGEEIVKKDIRINKFKDKLDNEIEVSKTKDEIKIVAKGQKYIYKIENQKYKYNDFSLIDFISKYKEENGKKYIEKEHIIYEVSKNGNTSKLILNKKTKMPIALINLDKNQKILSKVDYLKLEIKESI